MKMTNKFFALPVLMGALLIAGTTQNAHAAPTTNPTATTLVTLDIDPIVDITATANTTLTPVRADYETGSVTKDEAVSLNVFSNTPYTVSVLGDTGSPTLASADISAKNTASGSFASIDTARQLVNSATASDAEGDDYTVDLQVALPNMTKYVPNVSYTNTITFTVAAAS